MGTRRVLAVTIVAALAVAVATLDAQAPTATTPQTATPQAANQATSPQATSRGAAANGVSAERLARIDAMLQSYVDRGLLPGAVALVLRDGRPVYQKAVGWADKEAGWPMRMDTMFRIASQTKALTSVAIYRINPQERLTIMLMVQLLPNATDIREKFPLLVYQALLGVPRLQ